MPLPANYRGLIGAKLIPMTPEQSEYLITWLLVSQQTPAKQAEFASQLDGVFVYGVLKKRVNAIKMPVSPALLGMLAILCKTPAHSVLWAFTLCHLWKEQGYGTRLLDGATLWEGPFGNGVPTDEEYTRLWDLQKMTPDEVKAKGIIMDNWLDDFSTWPLPPGMKEA